MASANHWQVEKLENPESPENDTSGGGDGTHNPW
jgi:hypothetical protein